MQKNHCCTVIMWNWKLYKKHHTHIWILIISKKTISIHMIALSSPIIIADLITTTYYPSFTCSWYLFTVLQCILATTANNYSFHNLNSYCWSAVVRVHVHLCTMPINWPSLRNDATSFTTYTNPYVTQAYIREYIYYKP